MIEFNALILSIALSTCPTTVIVNKTEDWNPQDQGTLDRATVRCSQIYSDAPCLKVFTKKETNAYTAQCGAK